MMRFATRRLSSKKASPKAEAASPPNLDHALLYKRRRSSFHVLPYTHGACLALARTLCHNPRITTLLRGPHEESVYGRSGHPGSKPRIVCSASIPEGDHTGELPADVYSGSGERNL